MTQEEKDILAVVVANEIKNDTRRKERLLSWTDNLGMMDGGRRTKYIEKLSKDIKNKTEIMRSLMLPDSADAKINEKQKALLVLMAATDLKKKRDSAEKLFGIQFDFRNDKAKRDEITRRIEGELTLRIDALKSISAL